MWSLSLLAGLIILVLRRRLAVLTVGIDLRLLRIWIIRSMRFTRAGLPLWLIDMVWELRISNNTWVTSWYWKRIGIDGGVN